MTRIIDLDEVLGDDKQVKLAGKKYVLPPDLPADLYLEINRFARDQKSEAETFEALYERVLGLFRYKQPDLKDIPISLGQLMAVIGTVYGAGDGEGDADPPRKAAGTRSTAPRSKTRSRRRS